MTKQEAKEQFKRNWEEIKRKGLVSPMSFDERVDEFINVAFDWAEEENRRKPTLQECVQGIKDYAKSIGAIEYITFKFD